MKGAPKGLGPKTGLWSLFDQGAVSLGNFLTQMILARSLSWSDYGVFALLYGLLFFLNASLGSLVTYPLSVRGSCADARGLSRLAGASLLLDVVLVFPEALIVLCAVGVLRRMELLVWALAALVFWQFQETLRRALMARLGHREAVWGDGLSYLGQAVVIFILARRGGLTLEAAFVAIAATSLVASVLQFAQAKPQFRRAGEPRALMAGYWRLGGWASSTNLANGITQQAFPWALGLLFGTAEAGSFQAVVNPLKAFNPLIVGTQNLIVPAAAKAQSDQGIRAASRSGLAYAAGGAMLSLPYLIVLVAWPHAVLAVLYGAHSRYTHLELVLRICVFAYAFGYWAEIVTSLLNGLGLPKAGFFAQAGATAAAVAIGLPLTIEGGLVGALAGLGICASVKAGIALYAVWTESRSEGAGALAGGTAL